MLTFYFDNGATATLRNSGKSLHKLFAKCAREYGAPGSLWSSLFRGYQIIYWCGLIVDTGTEPKLKYYVECNDPQSQAAARAKGNVADVTVDSVVCLIFACCWTELTRCATRSCCSGRHDQMHHRRVPPAPNQRSSSEEGGLRDVDIRFPAGFTKAHASGVLCRHSEPLNAP